MADLNLLQPNPFSRFFAGFTSFTTLAVYLTLSVILLSMPLTLLIGVLLACLTISSLIICQVNAIRLLENESSIPYLKEQLSTSIEDLKNRIIELEQGISLLEAKINYPENKHSDYVPPYEDEEFLPPPYSAIQTRSSLSNFFKPNTENSNHISANTYTQQLYRPT